MEIAKQTLDRILMVFERGTHELEETINSKDEVRASDKQVLKTTHGLPVASGIYESDTIMKS